MLIKNGYPMGMDKAWISNFLCFNLMNINESEKYLHNSGISRTEIPEATSAIVLITPILPIHSFVPMLYIDNTLLSWQCTDFVDQNVIWHLRNRKHVPCFYRVLV